MVGVYLLFGVQYTSNKRSVSSRSSSVFFLRKCSVVQLSRDAMTGAGCVWFFIVLVFVVLVFVQQVIDSYMVTVIVVSVFVYLHVCVHVRALCKCSEA